MSEETTEVESEEDYDWRLVKRGGDVSLELASKYQEFEGPMLTVLTRTIGEALIKIGTMFLQSRVEGDDEDEWDE